MSRTHTKEMVEKTTTVVKCDWCDAANGPVGYPRVRRCLICGRDACKDHHHYDCDPCSDYGDYYCRECWEVGAPMRAAMENAEMLAERQKEQLQEKWKEVALENAKAQAVTASSLSE